MKRIKEILVVFILLSLCSGCSINYNIEINKDTVKESIEVTDILTNDRSKEDILNEYQSWYPAYIDVEDGSPTSYDSSIKNEEFEYHNKNIKELDNGYYYTYKYNYPIYKYSNATATREAYIKRKFYIGNNYIIINTDKENLLCNYSYFEELKVSISIDKEVYKLNYTNADERKDNTYIWNIDRNNCDNSEILLKLDIINKDSNTIDNNNNNTTNDNKNNTNNYVLYILFAILVLIIYLGYKWFNNLKEKNNNID